MARPLRLLTLALLLASCSSGDDDGAPLGERRIAFARDNGVFVGQADGTKIRRLTEIDGFEYQPDWSPDGARIALRVDENRAGGVWVVNRDGSDPRNLDGGVGIRGGAPDWSPDGERIAFAGRGERDAFLNIYAIEADGSNPERLTSDRAETQYPAWSPDGRRIAFTLVEGGGFDIYSMRADGSNVVRLTDHPGPDNWPEWSPDGSEIVFSSDREGVEGLYRMDADGSNERLLAEAAGEPSWSPDGEWIAVNCKPWMCALRPDGSERVELLGGKEGSFPAWDPADD